MYYNKWTATPKIVYEKELLNDEVFIHELVWFLRHNGHIAYLKWAVEKEGNKWFLRSGTISCRRYVDIYEHGWKAAKRILA